MNNNLQLSQVPAATNQRQKKQGETQCEDVDEKTPLWGWFFLPLMIVLTNITVKCYLPKNQTIEQYLIVFWLYLICIVAVCWLYYQRNPNAKIFS